MCGVCGVCVGGWEQGWEFYLGGVSEKWGRRGLGVEVWLDLGFSLKKLDRESYSRKLNTLDR